LTAPDRERLWLAALDALVAVHRVDWRARHAFLTDTPTGEGGLGRRIEWTMRYYEWAAAGRSYPVTDVALAHVVHELPASIEDDPRLLWNDARIGNILFTEDFSVAAVVDWEGAAIGPVEIDVGWWLMMDDFFSDAVGVSRLPGLPTREETLGRYGAKTGSTLQAIEYFEILAALVLATTVIRTANLKIARGDLPEDTALGSHNTITQMLARRLALPVPPLAPEWVAFRRGHEIGMKAG
jgi:aminoglycoside phosphotransferase (APT) family kinase protein